MKPGRETFERLEAKLERVDMAQIWPQLGVDIQEWLVDHNGEPLPAEVVNAILAVTSGARDPRWWAGDSRDGQSQLTDEAVDWIEEIANLE